MTFQCNLCGKWVSLDGAQHVCSTNSDLRQPNELESGTSDGQAVMDDKYFEAKYKELSVYPARWEVIKMFRQIARDERRLWMEALRSCGGKIATDIEVECANFDSRKNMIVSLLRDIESATKERCAKIVDLSQDIRDLPSEVK